MPVTTTTNLEEPQSRLFVTRYGDIDPKQLRAELAERAATGQITTRDEQVMEYLRELHVLSLDHIHRLWWTGSTSRTAYNRLAVLKRYRLISYARIPVNQMRLWNLAAGRVYALNLGGWMWLREDVNPDLVARSLKREQILHDLLASELCVRIIEATRLRGEAWQTTWVGEEAASYYERSGRDNQDKKTPPAIAPDGLAIVRRQQGKTVAALPFFLEIDTGREAHGRPSSDWGRKVRRYDLFISDKWREHPQLADLPEFPAVAVVTHGAQRLLNLAHAIQQHRKEPVSYYLALWEDLITAPDILSAPAWMMLPADGKVLGQERDKRRALLPPVATEG